MSHPFPFSAILLAVVGLGGLLPAQDAAATQDASPRQVVSFDRGWKFHLGEASGAEQPGFADAGWQAVDLPHDWMIAGVPGADPSTMDGPFDRKSLAGAGGAYLNGGIGWYRKTFTVPTGAADRRVALLFDGAYMDSDVYLNGQKLGNRPYGFSSFYYDLTPGLKPGDNVVAVRLNVEQPCCRWYSGAGLYRDVWLITTAPVHLTMWGTALTTPEVSPASARVHATTRLENAGGSPATGTLTTIVLDAAGHEVARQAGPFTVGAGTASGAGTAKLDQDLTIPQPQLWSCETPTLYTAVSEVRSADGTLVDSNRTRFGVRTIAFDKQQGFLLNGQRVQIKGVCDHHDLGCLGSVALRRGFQRQLEMLKSMGCNALRTSHNPPSPELLDLCDEMGFLVMDECFDEWKENKTKNGYGRFYDAWWEKDLTTMLDRDRNHPSIILWSIGNEIPEGRKPVGPTLGAPMVAVCHREDPTRPVTSACPQPDNSVKFGFDAILDVFGINYNQPSYSALNGKSVKPIMGSETASSLDSRGDYGLSLDAQGNVQIQQGPNQATHQMPAYDIWYVPWGDSSETEEAWLKQNPWFAGEFFWTGFDYLGEPTPYPWPARSSYFGAIDLAGFPKDRYYMYQSQWSTKPMVHVMPHWNWAGWEGKAIPVWVFSNADSVELFLNGRSLGVKQMATDTEMVHHTSNQKGPHAQLKDKGDQPSVHVAWSVPYAPGELKAVASRGGQVVATDIVRTAGAPAKIVLSADRAQIAGDGQDLAFLQVTVEDQDGNVCPNADNEIHFALDGTGAALAGTDNGNAIDHESFQAPQHQAYHGHALAVLRAQYDGNGTVNVTASADGLTPATAQVTVVAAK